MNNYKATPEQWYKIEQYAKSNCAIDACLLELRARVKALEALANHFGDINRMVPPSVATDEELSETWYKAPGERMNRFRALYDLGVAHGQAGSREVADPAPVAEGLVERVSDAITSETGSRWASTEARAAILEVARWLREQRAECSADLLEQEAGR